MVHAGHSISLRLVSNILIYILMYTWLYIYVRIPYIILCIRIYMYMYTHMYVYIYLCIHIYPPLFNRVHEGHTISLQLVSNICNRPTL